MNLFAWALYTSQTSIWNKDEGKKTVNFFVISLATRSIFMYSSRISSKVKRGKANRRHVPQNGNVDPVRGYETERES